MALSSDILLERLYLKRRLIFWRLLAIGSVIFFLVMSIERQEDSSPVGGDFIARITIDDMVLDDRDLYRVLNNVESNDKIKGLVLWLDTPGGTAVGGEAIYKRVKEISKKKPVVAVMRTMCTSAGYMVAMGANHVVAMEGTITGSIGVILQAAEFTRLADKLGITPITIKSGAYKASPNPTEPFTEDQRRVLDEMVSDFFDFFVRLVAEARHMDVARVRQLADGRVYTGAQALKLGLIDAIGGEEEATQWLEKQRHIDSDLEIREMRVKEEKKTLFEKLADYSGLSFLERSALPLDGLLAVWQPALLFKNQ